MDRELIYPGTMTDEAVMMALQKDAMVGEGYIAQGAFGTLTVARGLTLSASAVTATVGPGFITNYAHVDDVADGVIAVDLGLLLKVYINTVASGTLSLPAATAAGQAINYLIQAQPVEADVNVVVLPYYNSADPDHPFNGPNNSGATSTTRRTQSVAISVKAGTQAPTGSQVAPTADLNWYPLHVVTCGSAGITGYGRAPGHPFFDQTLPTARRTLNNATTFYVNGNYGADTSTGGTYDPFQTLQGAYAYLITNVDANGYQITVDVASGTYAGLLASGAVLGLGGLPVIISAVGTVTVAGGSTHAVAVIRSANLQLNGLTLTSTGGSGIYVNQDATVLHSGTIFGTCSVAHMQVLDGGYISAISAYSVSGGAAFHWYCVGSGSTISCVGLTITFNSTVNFTNAFAVANNCANLSCFNDTFSGSATGQRYAANYNGVVYVNGGSATYLPGNAAGATNNGGVYA